MHTAHRNLRGGVVDIIWQNSDDDKDCKVTALTLISPYKRPLRPLVEAALQNEQRLLQAGIRRTEQRVKEFEKRYSLDSEEFLRRYANDEFDETLELIEWIGEYRLLESMREDLDILQEIHFED